MSDLLADQFAFRPTSSTTAAVIGISHHINEILAVDDYPIIISLDFAKAFYIVCHSTLAHKLSTLELPDSIYNWLVEFLQDRTHSTLFAGRHLAVAHIIQGSGLGSSQSARLTSTQSMNRTGLLNSLMTRISSSLPQ